jgi:hypothetical protein
MASTYSKFTYDDLDDLQITVMRQRLFLEKTGEIEPSSWLQETLKKSFRLPLGSEKVKSEAIILPVLQELIDINKEAFTFYSGYNFDVDKAHGLKGRSDYLLSLEPMAARISAPIFSVVEAKNDNLEAGVPQCVAQMYAAQIFNKKRNKILPAIYGAVTFGIEWQFLKLEGQAAFWDTKIYYIEKLPELLGVLQHTVHLSK